VCPVQPSTCFSLVSIDCEIWTPLVVPSSSVGARDLYCSLD
jgi:hypothetical protein